LGLLGSLIDANANAQQQFLTGLRRRLAGYPLLDAGIEYVEAIARQRKEFGHTVIHHVERAFSPGSNPESSRAGEPETSGSPPAQSPESAGQRDGTAQRSAPIRLSVPLGRRSVAVPLHLHNHRNSADIVSFSAAMPTLPGVAVIPLNLLRFEPETLVVPPQAEAAGQLLLYVSPDFLAGPEYWSDIVIAGEETRRVPLVLEVIAAVVSHPSS